MAPKDGTRLRGRSILVVEDHEDMRTLIEEYFVSGGAMVTGAENGLRAREALVRERFDLIVTDIAMPTESGIEMMERIRAEGLLMHIPAIAISGQIRMDELEQFSPALFQAVLAKPFDPSRLVAIAIELMGA